MGGLLLSEIINRSVIAWYCVIVIYLVRLFLKKISRKYCYFLWLVVFLNLCIPFSVVSSFSLIPQKLMEFSVEEKASEQPKPEMTEDSIAGEKEQNMVVFEGGTSYEEERKEVFTEAEVPGKQEAERDSIGVSSKVFWLIWGERIWILGIFVLGCYSLWETFRFNQSLKKEKSTLAEGEEHIRIAPNLSSPVLWGFFSPTIYLPQDLEEGEKIYIIAHEKYHRKRKDYLVKPIIYIITMVYWFHPLVWLAYHLCCEDMEMSCDEAVLEKAGSNIRKEYAHSLLKYAAKQNGFLLHPLTFGEPSLRSRIEYILRYRKRNVYMTAATVIVAATVGIGLILRPVEDFGSGEEIAENTGTEVLVDDDTRAMTDRKPGKNGAVLDETVKTIILNNGGEIIQVNRHTLNNDGEIIQADRNRYYMGEKPLYTNGEFLYRTNTDGEGTDHIWQYEMDQRSGSEITSGTIVGMSKNDKVLYYIKQDEGEETSFWTYYTESKAMHKMYEGEDSYLAFDDEWVYHYGKTDAGLYINRNRLEELEGEENLLRTPLDAEEISCFYVTDSHLLFTAGAHEGSAGYFYGDFYSFDMETKKLVQKHLTDDDSFAVFDGKIYYSKYSNEGNRGSGLYCADFNLNNETLIGESMEFIKGMEEKNRMLVSQHGRLLSVSPDGKDEICIYDALEKGWDIEEYDKLYFKQVNVIDNVVFACVEQWGYRDGNGWRDSLIASQKYNMLLDGSQSIIWSAEDMEQETKKTLNDSSNPMPGQPCDDPQNAGWNLQNVTDVRNDFFRMPLEPEEGTEDKTYLLGKTESYILYGKGDYETMLLECEEKYSEITYFYASNYMDPLQLFESDIDNDGKTELAIKFRLQMGTGISIDTFLLADFGEDNELYVHQYLAEEFTKQLAEVLSFEKTKDGVQAMVNGKNAGTLMANMEGRETFKTATLGAAMHFYYAGIQKEIQLSGDIMFLTDNVGAIYDTNGNDVTATVNWDGEKFFLSDFTSKNRYLEEQVESDLSQFYGRNLYDVNVNYDSSKMNQEVIVIGAEVLKTETDSGYEDVEIQLKRERDSYVSGWEIEGIESKSPRTKKTTISFVVEGMKEEVPVVLYKGNGYSIYIPKEDWQMTGFEYWKSVDNENVELQIMDYEGESVEAFREQLLEDGYSLDGYGSVKLTKYDSEEAIIQNVRIQKFNDRIKGIFYSYPLEAEEGFGTRLERIVSTFGWEKDNIKEPAQVNYPKE